MAGANRLEGLAMKFLSTLDGLDSKLHPSADKPIWLAKFTMLSLLRSATHFKDYGNLLCLHEGNIEGEGLVKPMRKLCPGTAGPTWQCNLLNNFARQKVLRGLPDAYDQGEDLVWPTSVPNVREPISAASFNRYSTPIDVLHKLVHSQPVDVIILGNKLLWQVGVVVCNAKCWYFREVVFEKKKPRVDKHGLTYHGVFLSESERLVKPSDKDIPDYNDFDLWNYGVLVPDLTIKSGVSCSYAIITRTVWLTLDKNLTWSQLQEV